jgi:hypothetical protein
MLSSIILRRSKLIVPILLECPCSLRGWWWDKMMMMMMMMMKELEESNWFKMVEERKDSRLS